MFLRRAYDLIPGDVRAFSPAQHAGAIPVSLKDPRNRAEIEDLTSGVYEAGTQIMSSVLLAKFATRLTFVLIARLPLTPQQALDTDYFCRC